MTHCFFRYSGIFFLFLWLYPAGILHAQDASVSGIVTGNDNKPLVAVSVSIVGSKNGTSTDEKGYYNIAVPSGREITIAFSYIGYTITKTALVLKPGERKELNRSLVSSMTDLGPVTIEDEQERRSPLTRIDPKTLRMLPNASGNFEAIIKTFPGVASNNELSSQYSVRGGNYDENLVYVNDFEIYRPFLIRSGQQEGLSFINSNLVSSILFSAGGFEASYGDKMSSVLDIRYKRPVKFAGSAEVSLLGANAHIEGSSKNYRWSYLLGIRQKSNQYVLGSLETKGDYKPSFTDLQTLVIYHANDNLDVELLSNYSRSRFHLVPQNRETSFGTVNEALRLKVYFDGQEVDKFESIMSGLSVTYNHPNKKMKLKFLTSGYNTYETETFDIQGQYWLDELERDIGKSNFGEVVFNRGVGTYLTHARNYLDAWVYNAEHKGYYMLKKHFLQWGAKYQHEYITDKMLEWTMIDSAGYALPQPPDDQLLLQDVINRRNVLSSSRCNSYVQDNWILSDSLDLHLTYGIRAHYWEINQQLLISPRLTLSYKPHWKRDFVFRVSGGYYYQPPFYRELKDLEGIVHNDVRAQQSIHLVLGSDYHFTAWGRPFKYVNEVYYKSLNDLIPYKVDNVRIRYYGKNIAYGYATGIDMRVNGEFVKGIESWASLSVMTTIEDIQGDYYYDYYNQAGEKIIPGYSYDQNAVDSIRHEPGYIPRPTDQRATFSIFFQDYLPGHPNFKMHLNLVYGTGFTFGPPGYDRYKDVLRMPPYRRVDMGFSFQLMNEQKHTTRSGPGKHLKTMWLNLEVFNLLQVNNTVSYLWISDVNGKKYAVPNYLTARQLNIRLLTTF